MLTGIASAFFGRFSRFAPGRRGSQLYLVLRHLGYFLQECLLQRLGHEHYVICRLQRTMFEQNGYNSRKMKFYAKVKPS